MNFLQSPVWRRIQEIVGRDIFEIKTGNQTYRGVRRTRRVGPLRFRWHQVLGVCGDDVAMIRDIVRRDFSRWGDMFFQLGVVDELMSFPLSEKKSLDPASILDQRDVMLSGYVRDGWIMSRKEHMPLATVRTPLVDGESLYDSYHKEHRRAIRNAREQDFMFVQAESPIEWETFYAVWAQMSDTKGVGIMSRESFEGVMDYVTSEGVGSLFLLMDGDVVTAGALVVEREDTLYYVYGAANREYSSVGAHVYLQHQVMSRGHNRGYDFFDHRGVSSRAYPDHPLAGVSRFKERFGGEQIEHVGNIDLVHNRFLYRMMRSKKYS